MKQHSLLQTKLFVPPVRSKLVSRPRLLETLNEGLDRKLTIISAPAGFGKTTLISEWVHAMAGKTPHLTVAWLSLDEADSDPTRFMAYLIAALQTVEVSIGKGMLSALQSPQPLPVEVVLITLINEIAALADRLVLVLDDHHNTVGSPPINDALAFLVERLPPQMHMVIASREDPRLPLARMRARGQLTELRATDLRFTSAEATEFLNEAMGLSLSVEDVAALENRTEGWIAGLQLAAISVQGHKDTRGFIKSFTGSHRFVLDYLIEEVLEQQSEGILTFLHQTAILDRLNGSLCNALTGQGDGQATLQMLERANLFIMPLDEERRWYRYHHLFADLLRQRLRQTQPDQMPPLHHRASEWFDQNGFLEEAIDHALRAEDFERAARLIEGHIDAIWQRVEHTRLRRWLAQLPSELVFSRPHLCIPSAWDLFTRGQHDAAEQSLQAAEQALDRMYGEPSPPRRDAAADSAIQQIRGQMAAIRAFLALYDGDLQGTIRQAGRALDSLPLEDTNWRCAAAIALGDAHNFRGELEAACRARLQVLEASRAGSNIHTITSLKLADIYRQQGQLQRTSEVCRQQWKSAQELGLSQTVAAGWLLAIWGETLAELNDLDGAIRLAQKGVTLAERGRDAMVIGWSNLCLMRVLYSRGDMASIAEIIEKLENIARERDLPPFVTNPMAAWRARMWLAQGNLDAAAQWVSELEPDADGWPTLLRETEYLAQARILVAQGQLAEAARLLQRLLDAADSAGHTSRAIEILMLQALTAQAGGDVSQAMVSLERALTLAEPGGFVRVFVDEGPAMARLLLEALSLGIAPDYAQRLLAAFPVAEARKPEPSKFHSPEPALIEPLSEREIEVLQLIAQGQSNRTIADRLFVSPNTVKSHTRNIYGKLGVHNRTHAVGRAIALGILPST